MPKIKDIPAQSRIIIEYLTPQINHGRFPAKRVVGEHIRIECDLFADGHDIVNGHLLYRFKGAKKWQETPLQVINNDRWFATFHLEKQGAYEYTVEGWVDHALNWQHELERKIAGGQHVDVELLDGVQYLDRVRPKCSKKDQEFLDDCKKHFEDKKSYNVAIDFAQSDRLHSIFKTYPNKDYALKYDKILEVSVDRRKALFSAWYEFFPRSAGPNGKHGTFKDCLKVLPHVAEMGFDTVYFPPVHPIGESHRKGKNNSTVAQKDDPGSPWAIGSKEGGHKDILKDLGTLEDFKKVIKKANELGMEMAMDLAYQCSPDHPYVKEHPQWFKWRPDGSVQYAENPPKKYQDILPINFESEDWENLWNELLDIVLYWNKQGIKIFRVDNPHTKPFRFWEWLISEAKKVDQDLIFLAEAFTRPKIMHELAKVGFTQSYTYYAWRNSKQELSEYMTELSDSISREYFRPNFWPNTPDINPYPLQVDSEQAFYIRHFMAATLSSNYGIYGPVFEFMVHHPVPGKEEYLDSEKYEVKNWDWSVETNLKRLITKINHIRKDNPALQDTFNIQVCETNNENIFAYYKESPAHDNYFFMAVNLDPYNTQAAQVKVPNWKIPGDSNRALRMHDLITEQIFTWNGEWNYVELGGLKLPFHLFKIERT